MAILKVGKKDIPKLARLLTRDYEKRGLDFTQASIKEYLKKTSKKKDFYAFEEEGKMTGCVALKIGYGGMAELKDLTVKSEDALRSLVENVIKICHEKSMRKVSTTCITGLEGPLNNLGFYKEGLLKDHFREGEDLVIMSAKLSRKEDRQVNLKDKLEDIEVSRQASESLRKLPFRN